MRLCRLEDGEPSLVEFFGKNTPPYAVLSHTWGADDDEVTYKDLVNGLGRSKPGYNKIHFCGKQAAKDDLQYIWVDTCCIDKSNHTELHEAINSMFRWYQNATRCYVYLSDVSASGDEKQNQQVGPVWEPALRASRWFTRGWTLQELLAPVSVEFFTKDGQRLGDKTSLEQLIHEITGIAIPALRGSAALPAFDVEERFKWADSRQTTREEDWAYCLLGIFGVFMPLLYGEGKANAVRRLRREIVDAMARDDTPHRQEGTSPTSPLQPPEPRFIPNDTAEVSPLVASIMEVSEFGLDLSKRLREYGSAVVGVERRLSGLDKEISFTSGILSELGTLLNDARVQTLVSEQSIRLARDAVAECDGIFQAMEGVVANIQRTGFGKFRIYFRETKIELLRSNLGRMKGNLTLLMGVINHATQILLERPNDTTLAVHRQKIRELMIEKEAYTQRYLAEKRKYDTLLAQFNSTSTLGSISTTYSSSRIPQSSTACIQPEEHVSSTQNQGSTDEINPALSLSSHRTANIDGAAPRPDGPLDTIRLVSPQQEVLARSISPAPAVMPFTQNQSLQRDESTTESAQPKPSKRKSALKIAKGVARGTGYFIAGIAIIVTFPVSVPISLHVRRRSRMHRPAMELVQPQPQYMGFAQPQLQDTEFAHPQTQYMGFAQPQSPNHPSIQYGEFSPLHSPFPQYRSRPPQEMPHARREPYQSNMIPAELPGVHELSGSADGSFDLDLVGALTRIPLRRTQSPLGPYFEPHA